MGRYIIAKIPVADVTENNKRLMLTTYLLSMRVSHGEYSSCGRQCTREMLRVLAKTPSMAILGQIWVWPPHNASPGPRYFLFTPRFVQIILIVCGQIFSYNFPLGKVGFINLRLVDSVDNATYFVN